MIYFAASFGLDSAGEPPGQPVLLLYACGPSNTASTREILPSMNLKTSVFRISFG